MLSDFDHSQNGPIRPKKILEPYLVQSGPITSEIRLIIIYTIENYEKFKSFFK